MKVLILCVVVLLAATCRARTIREETYCVGGRCDVHPVKSSPCDKEDPCIDFSERSVCDENDYCSGISVMCPPDARPVLKKPLPAESHCNHASGLRHVPEVDPLRDVVCRLGTGQCDLSKDGETEVPSPTPAPKVEEKKGVALVVKKVTTLIGSAVDGFFTLCAFGGAVAMVLFFTPLSVLAMVGGVALIAVAWIIGTSLAYVLAALVAILSVAIYLLCTPVGLLFTLFGLYVWYTFRSYVPFAVAAPTDVASAYTVRQRGPSTQPATSSAPSAAREAPAPPSEKTITKEPLPHEEQPEAAPAEMSLPQLEEHPDSGRLRAVYQSLKPEDEK